MGRKVRNSNTHYKYWFINSKSLSKSYETNVGADFFFNYSHSTFLGYLPNYLCNALNVISGNCNVYTMAKIGILVATTHMVCKAD